MPKSEPAWQRCQLCEREVPPGMISLHHLVPKQKGGKAEDRTPVCRPCHKQIHATYGNADLARHFADLPALRAAAKLQPYLKWIRKQRPDRNFRTVRADDHPHSNRRRSRRR